MQITIDDLEFDGAIKELAARTGETPEETIRAAVQERLLRVRRLHGAALIERIKEITARVAAMPILDDRMPDDILGYNEHGHFD